MTDVPPSRVAAAALLLTALAAAAVAASGGRPRAEREAAREFQRIVGGVGLGRATGAARCIGAYDPRLSPVCSLRVGPLPGASPLCPDHALRPEAEAP